MQQGQHEFYKNKRNVKIKSFKRNKEKCQEMLSRIMLKSCSIQKMAKERERERERVKKKKTQREGGGKEEGEKKSWEIREESHPYFDQ